MKPRLLSIGSVFSVLCGLVVIALIAIASSRRDGKPASTELASSNNRSQVTSSADQAFAGEIQARETGSNSNGQRDISQLHAKSSASFSSLLAKAEGGDRSASLLLAQEIWKCLDVPLSRDGFDDSLSEQSFADQPSQANYNAEIERIDDCAGMPRDKKLAAKHFKLAADSGNLDAVYHYATILTSMSGIGESDDAMEVTPEIENKFRELDAESVQYLLMAAEKGHLQSAVALAAKYQMGFEVHTRDGRHYVREPDLFQAYAWYYAANITKGGLGLKWWKTAIEPRLVEQGQLLAAQARGQEIYSKYLQ